MKNAGGGFRTLDLRIAQVIQWYETYALTTAPRPHDNKGNLGPSVRKDGGKRAAFCASLCLFRPHDAWWPWYDTLSEGVSCQNLT